MPVWLVTLIPQIIQGVQAAVKAAPQAIAVIDDIKKMFQSWFTKNWITVEQQNALNAWADSVVAMAKSGVFPDAWQVQPDPGIVTRVGAGWNPVSVPISAEPPPQAPKNKT